MKRFYFWQKLVLLIYIVAFLATLIANDFGAARFSPEDGLIVIFGFVTNLLVLWLLFFTANFLTRLGKRARTTNLAHYRKT